MASVAAAAEAEAGLRPPPALGLSLGWSPARLLPASAWARALQQHCRPHAMATARMKELFRKYGRTAVGVHLSVYAASLAGVSTVNLVCITMQGMLAASLSTFQAAALNLSGGLSQEHSWAFEATGCSPARWHPHRQEHFLTCSPRGRRHLRGHKEQRGRGARAHQVRPAERCRPVALPPQS